jgi:hypothetical protein
MKLENILGGVATNMELRRYYLQHLFSAISSAGGAQFTMSFFFLYGGATVSDVILTMVIYAVSALLAIVPVAKLVNLFGVKKVHALHVIPKTLSMLICLYMVALIAKGEVVGNWFFLWMVVHGWTVMLKRIPLRAYFSHHGKNENRGKDIAFAQAVTTVAAILSPLFFGNLIDDGFIAIYFLINFTLSLMASTSLGLDKDDHVRIDLDFKKLSSVMPSRVKKALFFPRLVAPFMDDLFFIWILLLFGNSYSLVGGFVAVKLAIDLLLSWWVGQRTDNENVRHLYSRAIMATACFWALVPFISSSFFMDTLPDASYAIWVFSALQFTVGLATLVWDGPYESWYHNEAKSSGEPLGFALMREVVVQSAIIVGGLACWGLVQMVDNWHWFILLGVPATLARLWMMPANR